MIPRVELQELENKEESNMNRLADSLRDETITRPSSIELDQEPLIHQHKLHAKPNCCGRLCRLFCGGTEEYKEIVLDFTTEYSDQHDSAVTTDPPGPFPVNKISNQKYNIFSFVPKVLYEQFKFFFNLYFLIVALTQFYAPLQVGFLFTYIAPLAFVLSITMMKEGYDDIQRWRRDTEANSQLYERLTVHGIEKIPSSDIKVGDLIKIHTNQRVPADMVLFRTNVENEGTIFIRTDQLDGETDWKLRKSIPCLQKLPDETFLTQMNARLVAAWPKKEIYEFTGNFVRHGEENEQLESLNLENTLWANTVVASGIVVGCVVYTGKYTRSALNTSEAPSKVGILDVEVNRLAKLLFAFLCVISLGLVIAKGFTGVWYLYLFRFALLLSSIIPISLRVNLDMGKTLYSFLIMRDQMIPKTIVRNSTIPEELGRITYLFSDKTGTLTQNVMRFKKLQLEPPLLFDKKSLPLIQSHVRNSYEERKECYDGEEDNGKNIRLESYSNGTNGKDSQEMVTRVIRAMALCHNVTPVVEEDGSHSYQASSPDEIALVKFSESVGLVLKYRTTDEIHLETPTGGIEEYQVLNIFPFTSESKRMGIIVRRRDDNCIIFYLKGAECVMQQKIEPVDWLLEEVDSLAREGLRTLVFAEKELSEEDYVEFSSRYAAANAVVQNRDAQVTGVRQSLEHDMNLLGISGVEDRLQDNVKTTLETLKHAGIKIWMLTGDKAETATCIGRSARLISHGQEVFPVMVRNKREAARQLDLFGAKQNTALVIDGPSLQFCLDHFREQFIELSVEAPVVIACRCSPQQKADIVTLIKEYSGKRVCAVGDGGNDVSMIQASNVGIGIVGVEGKQASLAADFSVNQFSFIQRLILWHGRNSYIRSSRLSQFVFHRGLIISIVQAVFSALFYFAAVPIFNGWLLVGYATFYTMAPVFSLVLDEDVSQEIVLMYPELYRDLQRGRPLSYKTFFIWVFKSVYQGGIIIFLAMILFEESFINIVAITFTALIFSELLNVALEINTWNWLMVLAEVASLGVYAASLFILTSYFDYTFVTSLDFLWKTLVITAVSCLPVSLGKYIHRKLSPPVHSKVKSDI